jgi:hypothetical protein
VIHELVAQELLKVGVHGPQARHAIDSVAGQVKTIQLV